MVVIIFSIKVVDHVNLLFFVKVKMQNLVIIFFTKVICYLNPFRWSWVSAKLGTTRSPRNNVRIRVPPLVIGCFSLIYHSINCIKVHHVFVGFESEAEVIGIFVEEVAMDGPVEGVFESTAIEDLNPLLLCRSPCYVRRC